MLCQLGPRGASSDAGAQRTTRDNATSTTHQLVAQPRKVREGCVTTAFSHRMISRSWSTENGVSPPLTRAAAAAATATQQHRARARHPARRTRHARSHSTAAEAVPPNSTSTRHHARTTTHDDEKDAACPHGHKAEDADRWGKRKLGSRPGNGAPLRARAPSIFLPCERGLNSHTDAITRPHLSLAF